MVALAVCRSGLDTSDRPSPHEAPGWGEIPQGAKGKQTHGNPATSERLAGPYYALLNASSDFKITAYLLRRLLSYCFAVPGTFSP